LGFAIPINTAKRIVQEIINTGTSTMPIIGVQLDLNSTQDGALIADVHAGGPASKAGIGNGTLITAIDGVKVHDSVGLIVRIRAKAPGEVVTLTSESGSTFSVTLGSQTLSS
jgi:putative serine protease PepD